MRICLVSAELSPFAGGGAGTYAREMAVALAAAGHQTHVLTYRRPGLERGGAHHAVPGATIHVFDTESGAAALKAYPARAMRHAMAVYEALLALHAEHRFDVIEFPDFGGEGYVCFQARRTMGSFDGCLMAVRAHTPITVCRELNRETWLTRVDATVEHMESLCLREADVLVSPSHAMLELLGRSMPAARREDRPEAVVANPLAVPHAAPEPTRADAPARILYFGRLEWRKGPDVLVRALRRLASDGRDFRATLVGGDTRTAPGGGSMRDHLHAMIGPRLAPMIDLREPAAPGEVADLIDASHVCVLPSRWENFGYVIAESLARGACVVSTRAGGTSELIQDGVNGLLVPSEDDAALAAAIARALDDAPLRRRLGTAGAAHVRTAMAPDAVVRKSVEAWNAARDRRATSQPRPAHTVSVVIPHRDLEAFLPEAIDSILAQTRAPAEIIVVDDASSREPARNLLDRLERDGSVTVVRRTSCAGPAGARNTGLRRALSTHVLFLDADDIAAPTLIERLAGALERQPGGALAAPLVAAFRQDPTRPDWGWTPLGFVRDMLAVWNVAAPGSGVLVDRDRALAAGGFDVRAGGYEDWDFFAALAARGERAEIVPEFLLLRRVRDDSRFHRRDKPMHARLHAEILARHPRLAERPDVALRLMLASRREGTRPAPERPGHGRSGPAPEAQPRSTAGRRGPSTPFR